MTTTTTTTTIDTDDFEIEHDGYWISVGKGKNGYYFSLFEDNGAHPNSPYYRDFEYEDGPFPTLYIAIDEGISFVNTFDDWGV